MSCEGVRILLALESRLKPPPSDVEAEELLEFFKRKENEMFEAIQEGFSTHDEGRQWLLENEEIPLEDLPYISISQQGNGSWAILENRGLFAARRTIEPGATREELV